MVRFPDNPVRCEDRQVLTGIELGYYYVQPGFGPPTTVLLLAIFFLSDYQRGT